MFLAKTFSVIHLNNLFICYFQDIPIIVIFKAMGFQSDQLIIQMVGVEERMIKRLISSLEECEQCEVFTQNQALKYVN